MTRKGAVLAALAVVSLAALSACATTPKKTGQPVPPPKTAPPPVRPAPAPKPGQPASLVGVASYYAKSLHGRHTANGERYDMQALTAAHKTLPFGSRVRVTNLRNGRSVVVRINDRGPFAKNRLIDLSYAAARELQFIDRGTTKVRLEVLDRP